MTVSFAGTPAELKQLAAAAAAHVPALAMLKDVELRAGHVDLTLAAPALGEVVARVQVEVTAPG
jgi:hypothetical protein